MANYSGKSRYPIDGSLILRASDAAAVTTDTDLAVQKLVSNGAVWQDPADVRDGEIGLVVQTGAFGGTSPTIQVDVYTAEDASKTNPKLFASYPLAASSWEEIALDQQAMKRKHAAGTHWYVTLNVGGTSPSIPVFAYLSKKH
jgi:hypothetical protein